VIYNRISRIVLRCPTTFSHRADRSASCWESQRCSWFSSLISSHLSVLPGLCSQRYMVCSFSRQSVLFFHLSPSPCHISFTFISRSASLPSILSVPLFPSQPHEHQACAVHPDGNARPPCERPHNIAGTMLTASTRLVDSSAIHPRFGTNTHDIVCRRARFGSRTASGSVSHHSPLPLLRLPSSSTAFPIVTHSYTPCFSPDSVFLFRRCFPTKRSFCTRFSHFPPFSKPC
jgi:hypothetical protein